MLADFCLLALPLSFLAFFFGSDYFFAIYFWLPYEVTEYEKLKFPVVVLLTPVLFVYFILNSFFARDPAVELLGPPLI